MSGLVDYAFVGRGASAALMVRALEKAGLLVGKQVLFLDPDPKTRNDKTFCFWAEESETVVTDLQDLIGHSWDRAQAGNEPMGSIAPLRYYQINSLDVYEDLSRRIAANGWECRAQSVETVGSDAEGPFAVCGSEKVRARWILDSRPPKRPTTSQVQGKESVLLQSFYGWIVETEQE